MDSIVWLPFKIGFWFLVLAAIYHLLTRKFLNPFKLSIYVGKKGCGKSTNMARLALKYQKKGWTVYSNEPMNIEGVRVFNTKMLGSHTPEKNSLVLVDEAGIYYHKRDFKEFAKTCREWYKKQRHYKCRVIMFSQTWDIDLTLRELTDDMYLLVNIARVFTWAKRIRRSLILTEPFGEQESRLADRLQFDSILLWPFGSRFLCFIPKYIKYFDSYETRPLPALPYTVMHHAPVPPWYRRRSRRSKR